MIGSKWPVKMQMVNSHFPKLLHERIEGNTLLHPGHSFIKSLYQSANNGIATTGILTAIEL